MQDFWYGTYKHLRRAVVVAETNKHLCCTEIQAVTLSFWKEKGKLARLIALSELRCREYLTQ